MGDLSSITSLLNTVLLIGLFFGGFFAFRSGKRQAVVTIQRETIDALQARIDALESRQLDLDKENSHLRYVIETIQQALSQEGFGVTINGDMVTIRDQSGRASSIRRSSPIIVKTEKKEP